MALSKAGSTGGKGMTGNREDVIETLIDMDPCGAAYRVSKTMVRIILSENQECTSYVCFYAHVVIIISLEITILLWIIIHQLSIVAIMITERGTILCPPRSTQSYSRFSPLRCGECTFQI